MKSLFSEPNEKQRKAAQAYERHRKAGRYYEAAQLMRRQYEMPEGGDGFMGEVFRLQYRDEKLNEPS